MSEETRIQELLDNLDSNQTPEEVCGNDAELLREVRARWEKMRRVKNHIDDLFPAGTPTWKGGCASPDGTIELPQIEGYDVESVLGRGGMGVVFKAKHRKLNRFVAVKMMLGGSFAGPLERARFQHEAEAVAALGHPNIVQIHDVGDLGGLPYFTMEIVEGGSLAQKLVGKPEAAIFAAALLVTLAEAVQVAHEGGIVHRDLKPSNILLTTDGTPKISDFGLARRLEGGAELTQSGVAVGTPSYMAPEQARGQKRAIGPEVDVYAVGAILYELLTGRPPFRGETPSQTLQQVINQEPVPPRQLNAKVPRDLEVICLKCLQKDARKRYPTAADLAADLGRFLRHEPIRARPTGPVEHGLRWLRRHPAATGLLAAVVLLMLVAGVGAGLQYHQWAVARDRRIQTDWEVHGVLDGARGLLKDAWQAQELAQLTEALAEGNRAADIARSGAASAAAQQEAETFRADAEDRLGLAKKNRALTEAVLDLSAPQETWALGRDDAGHTMVLAKTRFDDPYAAAFRRWGLDVDSTAEADVVARLSAQPDVFVQELIVGLDAWMLARRQQNRPEAQWQRLFRIADQLDRNGTHRRLRALLVGKPPPRPESVAGLVGAGLPWLALWKLARGDNWQQLGEVRVQIDPRTEPVLTVVLLARADAAVGDAEGAERLLREALAARPDQVVLLEALGQMLDRQGPSVRAKAIEYFRAARAQRPQLGIALSVALIEADRAEEGQEVLQELIRQQPKNPWLLNALAVNLNAQKKHGAAEAACHKAIDLLPDFPWAYDNLGLALAGQAGQGAAEAAYRKAIDLQPDFARAYMHLAVNLNAQHKHEAAEAACQKAIDLQPDFAWAYTNLGTSLILQKKYAAAEAVSRKAIDLNPNEAKAQYNLGVALAGQGKHQAAEAAYRKAIEIKPDLAEAHNNLGSVLMVRGQRAAAEAAFRKALEFKPDLPEAQSNLVKMLDYMGRFDEADAAFRKAIDLNPNDAVQRVSEPMTVQGQPAKVRRLEGELKPLDPRSAQTKGPMSVCHLKLVKDETVIIRLNSEDFDAALVVEDSAKKQLAFNDDDPAGATLNSKLVFIAPKDDTYRIVATSLDRKSGKYELIIEPVIGKAKEFVKLQEAHHTASQTAISDFEKKMSAEMLEIRMKSTAQFVVIANGFAEENPTDPGAEMAARAVADGVRQLGQSQDPEVVKILQTLSQSAKSRQVKGLATFALAESLMKLAETAFRKDKGEAEKLSGKAQSLFEEVLAIYGDIESDRLKVAANDAIYMLNQLSVGKMAPSMHGTLIGGEPFNLADFRGKVTVVYFWGSWCPPCVAMIPHERELAKKHQNAPFALVGINSDSDKAKTAEFLEQQQSTWTQVWDGGGTKGPLSLAWKVHSVPTIYVLDASGVIRLRSVGDPGADLERVIDALLAEMASKG